MIAIIGYVVGVVGLVGIAFGVTCYMHLREWARQCQGAQIAIAYKRKVQLSAPLVEWLTWSKMLKKGEERGRVVFRQGGVSVAIIRKPVVKRSIGLRRKKKPAPAPQQVREGTWSARDETKQGAKA